MQIETGSVAKDFPLVCVGGSVGGFGAYTLLLKVPQHCRA
jgi:hypothetical protein